MTDTRLKFDGKKDPERRTFVETLPWEPISVYAQRFKAYRKTALTYAAKINVPFTVDTLEGVHEGKAGDYLAVGAHGEMYPIDAAVFEATYVERSLAPSIHSWTGSAKDGCSCGFKPETDMTGESYALHVNLELQSR